MFSTANGIPHFPQSPLLQARYLHEDFLDPLFRAVSECVEESVVSSMLHARPMRDRTGRMVHSLAEYL